MSHKHIYLVGDNLIGIRAYSYSKDIAKLYIQQHVNSKYKIVKVKLTENIKQNLHDNLEINDSILTEDRQYLLTEDEENYILDSFDDFMSTSIHSIDSFIDKMKYLEFNIDESEDIKNFINFLKKLKELINKMDDEYCDINDVDQFSLINMGEVVKFALKYLL